MPSPSQCTVVTVDLIPPQSQERRPQRRPTPLQSPFHLQTHHHHPPPPHRRKDLQQLNSTTPLQILRLRLLQRIHCVRQHFPTLRPLPLPFQSVHRMPMVPLGRTDQSKVIFSFFAYFFSFSYHYYLVLIHLTMGNFGHGLLPLECSTICS